ncbi:hypothetical protein [Paenibacillus sp. FSL H3-0310]
MTSGLTTSQLRAGTKPTETEMAKDLTNIERYKEAAKVNKDVKSDGKR